MMWMNRDDVEDAGSRFDKETTPNLHRGGQVLLKLMRWTDNHSDGWPYWQKPSRAAQKLMELLSNAQTAAYRGTLQDIQESELKAALTPIKSFLTRQTVDEGAKDYVLLVDKPTPPDDEQPEGGLFNVITPEERALLSEAVYTAIERQQDTLDYAKNHMEDYDPDDVEYMKKRLAALEKLAGRV